MLAARQRALQRRRRLAPRSLLLWTGLSPPQLVVAGCRRYRSWSLSAARRRPCVAVKVGTLATLRRLHPPTRPDPPPVSPCRPPARVKIYTRQPCSCNGWWRVGRRPLLKGASGGWGASSAAP